MPGGKGSRCTAQFGTAGTSRSSSVCTAAWADCPSAGGRSTSARPRRTRDSTSSAGNAGGQTTVTVVGPGGIERTVPFQAGVVGDTLTQVVSGLTVGDQVVVADHR